MKQHSDSKGVIVIEGHVQGLANARALGKSGIPVIVVSEYNCLARYSRYCKKFFRCPDYLTENFIDFLVQLAISEKIKDWVLLPSNDHAVYNISSNIEKLKSHYKIISPEFAIFNTIYNKEQLIRLCCSSDIHVPDSWFPGDSEDILKSEYKFPLLIKGKNGLTFYKNFRKKAFLANTAEDLKNIIKLITEKVTVSEVYLQNLLPFKNNKPVSFTSFSISGEIKAFWMGKKIREHPVNFGTATYIRSIYMPELIGKAEILIRKLNYTGVCEIEFMLDPRDNVYKLIEVNARTWLWVDAAIKSGINFPLMIYNYLNDIHIDYPKENESESEWMHYLTDIPFSLSGLVRGYYSPIELLQSYFRFPSPAVLNLTDILPSFAEILLLPFLIKRR